ncbi:MAG: FAD-dependent oxidoreductase [bacterium]
MERYVILGSGAAGKRAAEVIRKRRAEAEVVLVGDEPNAFYYRPMLGEFLAGAVQPEQIVSRDRDRLSASGVRLLQGVRVTSLDAGRNEVALSNGDRIRFDRLLIATGRKTTRLSAPGSQAKGIVYLDNLADAQTIASLAAKARRAVVAGSSIPALDSLRGLRGRGVACTYLIPEHRFLPGVLDPVASQILEDRLVQAGVEVLRGASIQEVVIREGRLEAVVTTRKDRIPADLLLVAAPQAPQVDFLAEGEVRTDQGIVVDDALRTSRDDIFAAGDVAQPPLAGGAQTVPQPGWLNAWRQGNVAGLNMVGQRAVYQGVLSLRIKVFDLDLVCLGLSDAAGPDVREESGGYPFEELPYIYKKLVYRKDRVAGAIFVGDVSEAGRVEHWIRQGLPAARCEKKLLDQMFLARPVSVQFVGALCPVCKFQIQVGDEEQTGRIATCPACGLEFRLEKMPNGAFRAVHRV